MKIKKLIPIGITAAAAAVCAAALVYGKYSESGNVAYVYHNGEEIAKLPLDGSTDGKIITIKDDDGNENVIEVTDSRIHMKSASCKDQLCVKMGYREHEDTPIVCLPNKVVIIIKEKTSGK